jgi:hypothetical protein
MQHLKLGLLSWFLAAICLSTIPVNSFAAERIILTSPQEPVAAGQNIVFRIRTQEFVPPSEAIFHFRAIGTSDYKTLAMEKASEIEFAVILEGREMLPPGIEYFFAVKDGRDRIFTFPDLDPRKNPLRAEVGLTSAATGELAFPVMDGARTQNLRPVLSIRLNKIEGSDQWTSLRLLVDGVDVSPLVVVSEQGITYTPQADLDYGKHTLTLEAMDGSGTILPAREWSFVIPHSEMFDKASAQIIVDAQTDLRLVGKNESSEPGWKVQSNATLTSVVETGNLKVSLDANGWYTEQEGDEETGDKFNLNNFLLEIIYREQRLAIGDLNVDGTELISQSISRRGGLLELNYKGTTAQAFLLRSDQVTGFDDFVDISDPDQRLFGGSLEQRWEGAGKITAKGTAVTGRNNDPDNFNTGSLITPSKGQIYTLEVTAAPFEEKLNLAAEYGLSRFDGNTADDQGYEHGNAWLVRFSGRSGSYDYGGGYKRLGQGFRSIIDTTAVDNREEYTLYGTKTFEESSLTASVLHNLDNMEKDSLLPVIRNTSFDLAYNLYKADWPTIFLNTNLTYQDSSNEPATIDSIKNLSQTLSGGFALIREKWNLMPSYTYTRFEDDSIADNDSQTHQAILSLGLQPNDSLSFNPSFSWSRTDSGSSAPTTETWQGSLAGTYLFSTTQDLYLTLSAIDSDTDDDSSHTITYDGICQYNWHPETWFLKQARKTISLRGRYNRIDDRVGNDSDEDYSIFLVISIGGFPLVLL